MTAAAPLIAGMRNPPPVRAGKPDDLAFVVDSWAKHANRTIDEPMRDTTARVRALLSRPGSRLFVAHVPGEPDAILGWTVLEDSGGPWSLPCIHYCYARVTARRQGVARALLGPLAGDAVEYSSVLPRGIVAPARWRLNEQRAST